MLYNRGVLNSYRSSLQTICVGNLAVGGTGKTPHAELIIRELLKQGRRVAYLSRGYKRTSKGMVVATTQSTSFDLGDEALQVHRKFPEIMVVVDANRKRALQYLETQNIDVVVLDDAFQHRAVTPTKSVVLIDWSMDIAHARLLPFGRLREPVNGLKRADVVIFTKCPSDISAEEQEKRKAFVSQYGVKDVRFSKIVYEPIDVASDTDVLLLTAIENPRPLVNHLEKTLNLKVELHKYIDHHRFTAEEITKAQATNKPIITTEKDWCRMNCPKDFIVAKISCEIII